MKRSKSVALASLVGFVVALVLPMVALAVADLETVQRVFVPGVLLMPEDLTDAVAGWPGLVNLLVAGVANGAVYGGATAILVVAARKLHDRSSRPA